MRFLSIQSSVAYGHVGNSAATFPLQRLGHEVWPVLRWSSPTTPGTARGAGRCSRPTTCATSSPGSTSAACCRPVTRVLSGYLGGPGICDVVVDAVARVKAANPRGDVHLRPGDGQRDSRAASSTRRSRRCMREQVVPAADIDHAQPVRARLPHRHLARHAGLDPGVGRRRPRPRPVDGAGDVVPAARRARRHDRDAGGHRRRRLDRPHPTAADEGQRLGRPDRRSLHRAPRGPRARPSTRWPARRRPCTPYSKETLDSGERELRIVAAQDAIAHPACEFEVEQVR